eukprot:8644692-Heterocapsa_arctica.AAC.1
MAQAPEIVDDPGLAAQGQDLEAFPLKDEENKGSDAEKYVQEDVGRPRHRFDPGEQHQNVLLILTMVTGYNNH